MKDTVSYAFGKKTDRVRNQIQLSDTGGKGQPGKEEAVYKDYMFELGWVKRKSSRELREQFMAG